MKYEMKEFFAHDLRVLQFISVGQTEGGFGDSPGALRGVVNAAARRAGESARQVWTCNAARCSTVARVYN
ncbi:MAG: hypothetical protein AB1510_01490 [Bacillota bacterium]